MFSGLKSLLKSPCKELKPVEPFPFKSNRISRGVRFQHYLILFPFYPEYKKCQHLYTFNLYTRKWGSVQLINSPEILENTDNYKVVSDKKDGFVLFGCYKAFQGNTAGNLFFQSQTMTLKKTLGRISTKIDQGELILEWKECEEADQLPYREKFSLGFWKNLTIFGGCDENGTVTNDFFLFNFKQNKAYKIELISHKLGGKENLPCARMNHGHANGSVLVLFGGEDKNSHMINDFWCISSISTGDGQAKCDRFNKNPTNRCPKLGTPCILFQEIVLYIGKSTTQTLPPFKNYLCAELFDSSKETFLHKSILENNEVRSQEEPLPFDGVPHTMEIFENRLILGFESSIYSMTYENGIIEPSGLESYERVDDCDEGVLIKKKNRPMNFKGHMRQYFEERPFPDGTFKVQGEEISAHRGILSVRCPFFGELFGAKSIDLWGIVIKINVSQGGDDRNKAVEITDLSPIAFKGLLEWLYCNEILDFKDEVAIELLKVTNKYSLPKLKIEAEKYLMKHLTPENILERANLAVELNARDLETSVVNFLVRQMNDVKRKAELKNFPDSIQERVCNMEKISDDSFVSKLQKIKM